MVITVSLKDALHERPGGYADPSLHRGGVLTTVRYYDGKGRERSPQEIEAFRQRDEKESRSVANAMRALENPNYVVKPWWSAAEYRTFDRLSAMVCSHIQSDRDRGRLWLKNFIDKHGKDKCDMMLAEIRRRDEQEWFKDKSKLRGA